MKTVPGGMRVGLGLLWVMVSVMVVLGDAAEGVEVRLDRSWRSRLIETVSAATLEDRVLFAEIALQEMIFAYDAELHNLSADRGVSRQRSSQWAAGTGGYLDTLESVLAQLPVATRIEVVRERVGPLRLVVDDMPVVVSGPDVARQEALEARILDAYCLRRDCGAPREEILEGIYREARKSRGYWSLSDRGSTFRTDDGLYCLFDDLTELVARKALCEQLIVDLRVIASSLAYLRGQGFPIGWAHLRLDPGDRGGEQRLFLNDRGDYLPLELAVLDRFPGLWLQAVDWVTATAEGSFHEAYFRDLEMPVP